MKLKRVGFFQELDHGDSTGPMLVDSVGRPLPDVRAIADYLRSGLLFVGCPGIVFDVLDRAAGPIGSPDILTDGEWAWPGDLPYYVEKHNVALPTEFLEHLRQRNFKAPIEGAVDPSTLEL